MQNCHFHHNNHVKLRPTNFDHPRCKVTDFPQTAGILGNFAVNIMSLLYFIQVFVHDSSSIAFWIVSLISSTGFALAMDKALVLDLSGDGVSFDNLWSGPGIPFGGSLIMMALDIFIYGFLAYYLDCVLPKRYEDERSRRSGFPKVASHHTENIYIISSTAGALVARFLPYRLNWNHTAHIELNIRNRIKKRKKVRMMDEEGRMMKTREEENESWMRNFEKRLNLEDKRNVIEAEELIEEEEMWIKSVTSPALLNCKPAVCGAIEQVTRSSSLASTQVGRQFNAVEFNPIPSVNGESGSFNTAEELNNDVEPVARELKGREAIKIVDLFKTFHACRKPEVKAVNGINLTIYEGQITAILGHNGAGKTTLFNILTGLTAPSAGTAFVFGYDIRDPNDMHSIRGMTGVCPQHDNLFDLLTPKEHLEFFAAVRGIPPSMIDLEVSKTLRDIDLVDKANTFSKHLSGGQKRKLSVGIAVIGDPKIIILDEPTAGVDPYSRRHMWSVLQNRRHGKCKLAFCKTIADECQPFLQRFQTSKPMTPYLFEAVEKLLRYLMNRCVKPDLMKCTGPKLLSIDTKKSENLILSKNIDIGFATKRLLGETAITVTERQKLEFIHECRSMLTTMIAKLQEKSPLKQKAVRGLSSLDPCVIQHSPQLAQKRFSFLLEELNHANIINDVLAENAKKEYLHFCNLKKSELQEIFRPCDQFSDEVGLDTIYGSFLIGEANYKHLWEVIKICLVLSHGNATVEGGFSVNKSLLVENMHEKTVIAQRHIHDEIQEAGGIKNIHISKKMLDYVRGARKRYHEYLEMKKQEKSEKDKKKAEKRKLDIQVKDLEGERKKLMMATEEKREAIDVELQELKKKQASLY
uniref:ABC transporter domain-containing protein n=1 Tax=Timema cristinae TaxID=61476 RepID=A0A7R9H109_TIMCR|nr:unnamed protein product [Timema cristinae]